MADRCIACSGKGWRWQRGRTGEPRMVKRTCPVCKGKGRRPAGGKRQG